MIMGLVHGDKFLIGNNLRLLSHLLRKIEIRNHVFQGLKPKNDDHF